MNRLSVMTIAVLVLLTACFKQEELPVLTDAQKKANWDNLKDILSPAIAPGFLDTYQAPEPLDLRQYGWEDGLHISRDGLHLYALYFPGDLFGYNLFLNQNIASEELCDLLSNKDYIRAYADDFGMDMVSNEVDCEAYPNVDILYASRSSTSEAFSNWQLSGIARPGKLEGSPFPLFSTSQAGVVDIFLFTENNDIWMIRNTTANPSGIEQAVRLPSPINPVNTEFKVDNPHLERLGGNNLILVYERYTTPNQRSFMYSFSSDNGNTWQEPVEMNSIGSFNGNIEHPHLYRNPQGDWYLYYSMNCNIYRALQVVPGDWDSWGFSELVVSRGDAACVGEPTLTARGDLIFVVAYQNLGNNDFTDQFDLDPWILKIKN